MRKAVEDIPLRAGDWLRWFRLNLRNDNGARFPSSDEVGAAIGVTGRTVLRWETGESLPAARDIESLAEYLGLSPLQRAFFAAAFSTPCETAAPARAAFNSQTDRLLSRGLPAMLLDTLYYIRAVNSFADTLGPFSERIARNGIHNTVHMLQVVHNAKPALNDSDGESNIRYWYRKAWLDTAIYCGLPQYQQMIRELSLIPDFTTRWLGVARESETSQVASGEPYSFLDSQNGAWDVYTLAISMPPTYHLTECVPTDDASREPLSALRSAQAAEVQLLPPHHWSLS